MNPNAPEADLRLKIEIILLNPKGYRDDTAEILALIADTLERALDWQQSNGGVIIKAMDLILKEDDDGTSNNT